MSTETVKVDSKRLFDALPKSPDGAVHIIDHTNRDEHYEVIIRRIK